MCTNSQTYLECSVIVVYNMIPFLNFFKFYYCWGGDPLLCVTGTEEEEEVICLWCHTFFKAFCSIMGQLFTLFGKSKFIPNSLAPSRFLYSLNEQPHHRCMQAHGAVLVSTRMVACFQMHLHYNGFRCKLSHFNRKAWW